MKAAPDTALSNRTE